MWCQIAEMHMKGMNSVSPAIYIFSHIEASLVAQRVKSLPAMQETWVQILRLPWRRKWQPTPVFLPVKITWTEEPGRLQSLGSHRVEHD